MRKDAADAANPAAYSANSDSITADQAQASSLVDRIFQQEAVNFVLTNRIPRRLASLFMGWFSKIEQPVIRDASIRIWKLFAGTLNLHEARKTQFTSLHDCFIRELKPGARSIDPAQHVLISPCDAIIGACGKLRGTELIQAKGFGYTLEDLLGDARLVAPYRDGSYVTLRLRSNMYHRFHAPYDGQVDEVTYISGDTWNVNPIALKRIERLYCRNERAIVPMRLDGSSQSIILVPVAAILVASIHFEFLDVGLSLKYRGPNRIPCHASFRKGDEMGHFRHGSTIVVLGTDGLEPCPNVRDGESIRMGEPLLRIVRASSPVPPGRDSGVA
jgi:phosphatidylserine decarboxylase